MDPLELFRPKWYKRDKTTSFLPSVKVEWHCRKSFIRSWVAFPSLAGNPIKNLWNLMVTWLISRVNWFSPYLLFSSLRMMLIVGSEMRYKWVCVPTVLPTTSHAFGKISREERETKLMMDQEMGQDLTKHHHITLFMITAHHQVFFALICTSANKIQQVVGILKASTQCRKIYNELPFSRSALWIKMIFLKGSKGFKGPTGFKWVLRSP